MSEQAWTWLLFACEVVGIAFMRVIATKRIWWGWVIIVCVMTLPWAAYSILTQRWGFVALTTLWAFVYTSNAYTWRKQDSGDVGVPSMPNLPHDGA